MRPTITFTRLTNVGIPDITGHMSDPRMAEHMPLLPPHWDDTNSRAFVAAKEQFWHNDGLGHWGFLADGAYVGWGGFQKEGTEWDFGLVLRPDAFGLGPAIFRAALGFARADPRIAFATFLLPPSRKNLSALDRIGASFIGPVTYGGHDFLKFRLETAV